ncbi:hypothetical protein [Gloeobacter violaceus]|nr:hypothetical protein [Gloeobacter violaceus]
MKANPKTVVLYLGMIGFIVLSFAAISSYGTTNLRAPQAIDGRYILAGPLVDRCFAEPPLLVVGQSGSYLGADIVPADAKKNLLTRALKGNGLLHGQIDGGRMRLEGKAALGTCKAPQTLALEGAVTDGLLQGEIRLAGQASSLTGQRKSE